MALSVQCPTPRVFFSAGSATLAEHARLLDMGTCERDLGGRTSGRVIGAALDVHRAIGPGMLESVYSACLRRELELRRVAFRAQVPVSVLYKGAQVDCGYRMDFLVE